MNGKLRRYYERGQRCDRVNDGRAADFPANSKGAVLAAAVKEHLAELSALDVEKASSTGKRRQGTAGRGSAREDLWTLIESVARTAEAITVERPDIEGMFELPRKGRADRTLISTARSFAERAAPFVGLFGEFDLPATFINDLRSKADTLESYITLQNEGVGTGVNVNASAQEQMQEMNEALERLNIIYRNKYRNNPSVLAEWESAYHLEAAHGSRSKSKNNGNNPPPNNNPPT